ncbi:hypothetical protein FISHEDRAFT_18726, partial [Fistulina hepatica ATCC 64428]
QAALNAYSRRPDCFRRTTESIRVQCGQLELDEDARVHAAISMTLCELATAKHHTPPLECSAFAFEPSSVLFENDVEPLTSRECVNALSRSAQFWSSYSGYLREVPQLCYAFRRWNDIDTAREIFHNSTVEAMKLLRHMNAR